MTEHAQAKAISLSRPQDFAEGRLRFVPEARPAGSAQESGDVCGRSGRPADHDSTGARHLAPRRQLRLGLADHAVAVVHGGVCQLRRSHGRRTRQGSGGHAAQGAQRNHGAPPEVRTARRKTLPVRLCAPTIWCWSSPESSSPATAKWSKAWPRWTNRRSPASPRPSFAKRAATARPSPAARACSPMKSRCASPRIPARPFSTA